MEAWWPLVQAARNEGLDVEAIQACESSPFTVLAVDAPIMRRHSTYSQDTLEMLAKKVLLIFAVADQLESPRIFSGLLGGGAFRNSRPLVLLLHLRLQPPGENRPLLFHHLVFWSFTGRVSRPWSSACRRDDGILRQQGVLTLGDALSHILRWYLPLSHDDTDLVSPQERRCSALGLQVLMATQRFWLAVSAIVYLRNGDVRW
mmetsp:Transcript_21641/g.60059  ORF Transcript_21641/g.60059 Transcript_21641/m.60059 type:complete len:203 (-) Transcript_21641:128-736(-)